MSNNTLTVTMLDKEYQVACPPEEQDALRRAARTLDGRLRQIRESGSVVGLERIAIMAALNLSYELQQASAHNASLSQQTQQVQNLTDKVDRALARILD